MIRKKGSYVIEYDGKSMVSAFAKEDMSDEVFQRLRKQYYTQPNINDVINEFKGLKNGGVKNSAITKFYVKDLIAKTKIWYNKWCIEDVFKCKDLCSHFYYKFHDNKDRNVKIYPLDKDDITNLETAFRLGGKGIASKPANFPIKTVKEILKHYNVNNIWYDPSCGWGGRLCGALASEVTYLGTDPNYILVDRLKRMARDYNKVNNTNIKVDIRDCGSEEFQQDWVNKVGLCFTSPPYFYLEDYKIGKQSYTEGTTYEDWLFKFLKPTMENCYKYLIDGGYYAININNFKDFNLVEDTYNLALSVGFEFVENRLLKNIKRVNSAKRFNDNDEKIMIFKKKGS